MQFCPSYCLVGASPLPLGVEYLFLVESNILLLMNVQQLAAVLEFLQKMSTCTSTLPSYNCHLITYNIMNFNFKNVTISLVSKFTAKLFLIAWSLLSSFRSGLMGHLSGL